MGRLEWLIFHGAKESIFFYVLLLAGACFSISQGIIGEMFVSFSCYMYEDKEVLDE